MTVLSALAWLAAGGGPLAEPVPGDEGREAARRELERIGASEEGTSFARWWNELLADVGDWMPGGVGGLAALLVLAALVIGVLLVWRPRWRRRAKAAKSRPTKSDPPRTADDTDDDEVPEVPADELHARADWYAAAGRYREAVRERLRAMVRRLVAHGVIDHRPGWTVTELARAAGDALPAAAAPLSEAGRIFSDIWYGDRTADIRHDRRMRALTDDVRTACDALSVSEPATATATAKAGVSGLGGAA